MEPTSERWDIFCRVVDNYGDVAVSWRLARSMAREQRKATRLWLDDLTVLAKLRPEIDATLEVQSLEGVEVARIRVDFTPADVADVVVETFGCDPPEGYVAAMAQRDPKPRWINLEYLSAEEWVEGSHGLPSPNPRLPLTKHYFFPGFTVKTGGLLREESLLRRRDEFQADAGAQAAFWRSVVGRAPAVGALKVSLFGYAGAPYESLARAVAAHSGPVWLLLPEGVGGGALEAWESRQSSRRNGKDGGARREIEVLRVPFLHQDRYDQLLWACDMNFVRGEDSFIRAQWAGRPFAWNIYPTGDNAHWVKLAAFLARYTAGLDRAHAAAVVALWESWNRSGAPGDEARPAVHEAWPAFDARRSTLEAHARAWSASLAEGPELAASLADFVDNVL